MRSSIYLMLIFFLITISSCKKETDTRERKVFCTQEDDYAYLDNLRIDSLCSSDTCVNYQTIWKELFLEMNNLNEDFYSDHIELCESKINLWNDGISFSICYKVIIDWAIEYNCDQFIIYITSGAYPGLNLPRDTYLTKDDIRIVVENKAFSSFIIKLSNIEILRFASMDDAMDCLIDSANVNTLCSNRIYIDKQSGNLTLKAFAEYENEVNSCIEGNIDLINGDTEVHDISCMIF